MQIARKTATEQGENPFRISGSHQDAEFALGEAQRWLKPLPEKDLRQALVALHVKTVSARTGDVDLNLMLEIYLAELKAYPGDVVRDVLRTWPGKFFPAWAELRDAITQDRRIRERRQRIAALKDFLDGKQGEETGVKNPVTDAQIERMQAYARSLKAPAEMTGADDKVIDRLAAFDAAMEEMNAERKANRQEEVPYKRGNSFKSVEQLARESEVLKKVARKVSPAA